uniref:Uncharacterized protein n=1 Tax=Zea mays TaxID=4577 RepID=A0A804NLB8_MAIZE
MSTPQKALPCARTSRNWACARSGGGWATPSPKQRMVKLVRRPQTPSSPNASAAYPVAAASPGPTRRGQRARAVGASGHDVEAPVRRRAGDGRGRCVVAEAADGGRRPLEDGAHESVPDGGGDEPEVPGDAEAAPAPAVELPAVEHPADAVLARGQRPERRAHVDPLGPVATVAGQVPPAHVHVARALAGGPHGAEEVLPSGQRVEGVRGRVRLLARVVAAGGRAVEVDQQRRRRGRQERAHYGGGVRLGQREGGECGRRRGPPRREQEDGQEEEGGMEVEPARRRHGSAQQRAGRRGRGRGSGRVGDMVRQPRHRCERVWPRQVVDLVANPAPACVLCSGTHLLNCSRLSSLLERRGRHACVLLHQSRGAGAGAGAGQDCAVRQALGTHVARGSWLLPVDATVCRENYRL